MTYSPNAEAKAWLEWFEAEIMPTLELDKTDARWRKNELAYQMARRIMIPQPGDPGSGDLMAQHKRSDGVGAMG